MFHWFVPRPWRHLSINIAHTEDAGLPVLCSLFVSMTPLVTDGSFAMPTDGLRRLLSTRTLPPKKEQSTKSIQAFTVLIPMPYSQLLHGSSPPTRRENIT